MSSRPSRRRDTSRKSTSAVALPHHASPPQSHPPSPTTLTFTALPPQTPGPPDLSNLHIATDPPPKKKLTIKLIYNKGKLPARLAARSIGQAVSLGIQALSTPGDEEELVEGEEQDKEGIIGVEEFIREEDIEAMPSLEAPLRLTRKRRRGSGEELAVGLPTRTRKVANGVANQREERKDGRGRKKGVVGVNGISPSSKVVEKLKAEMLINGSTAQRGVEKKDGRGRKKASLGNGTEIGISSSSKAAEELKQEMLISIPSTSQSVPKTNGVLKTPAKPQSNFKPNDAQESKDKDKKGKDKDKQDGEKETLERNIDNIIFGDVTFKAWYPSWYPKEIIGEKALDGKGAGITVRELYVCRKCFGYSKVLVEWVRHCRCCEREVPGRRIYTHGEGEVENGGWSVWEVDGDVETLFCQNLSLFAKLFLDNKSVFFDVSGFNYFLLVHTSPLPPHENQIIGFFSKEKMSWDNNNLACILIFPPWQRKGLGSILMGVSYAIARREGIMGGPEKPISDLGKKGYRRFWGAEVARWLLGVRETDRKKGKGMVDVERVSREIWIAPEDCLSAMREMGIVEKAGRGKGTVERVRVDKQRVREWVERERLSLEQVVDEDGFVEGYALKEAVEEEDEEEEDEEMEEAE